MSFWSKALWSEVKSFQILAAEHGIFGTGCLGLGASHLPVRYLGPDGETSL